MKTLSCYSKEDIRIEDIPIPYIGADEILLRTIYCGLCGSDIAKIIDPEVKKPTQLGHEVIAIIEKTGSKVKKFKKGDLVCVSHHIPCFDCVYCDHLNFSMCRHFRETNLDPQGFTEYIRLSEEHVKYNTFLIDYTKYLKNAIFIEPVACCLRAVEKNNLKKGDKVVVIGCGTIGIIFISLFKFLYNAKVTAVDIDNNKLEYARKFGADLTINSKAEDLKEKISTITDTGFDVIELTYITKETVNVAMRLVRAGGSIQVFAGPSKERRIEIDFEDFYKREITLFSSYSSSTDVCKKSFNLLRDGKIDFTKLISKILPIEDFKTGLALALSQKYFKIIFYFNENFKNF